MDNSTLIKAAIAVTILLLITGIIVIETTLGRNSYMWLYSSRIIILYQETK
jgi:hypothetical protein